MGGFLSLMLLLFISRKVGHFLNLSYIKNRGVCDPFSFRGWGDNMRFTRNFYPPLRDKSIFQTLGPRPPFLHDPSPPYREGFYEKSKHPPGESCFSEISGFFLRKKYNDFQEGFWNLSFFIVQFVWN